MKEKGCDVCPGCRRHCPAESVRCKYGRRYFSKSDKTEKKRKWEKYVVPGGLAWRLLMVSRRLKKALRGEKISEAHAFDSLTPAERQTLHELLEKLDYSC